MKRVEIPINREILSWAVAKVQYPRERLAKDFPKYEEWLSLSVQPTFRQLEAFAKKTRIPFGYLFLKAAPKEQIFPIPFFRTIADESQSFSSELRAIVLELQNRQEWLKEYLMDSKEKALPFVGKFRNDRNVASIVNDMRIVLGLGKEWGSHCKNWEDALTKLTDVLEANRINVISTSILGNSTKRQIEVDECRGFVLVNDYVPFLFVNSKDSKSARMFTIAHELAHIWIGESAAFDLRRMAPANNETEKLCDKIAAEFLVPANSLENYWKEEKGYENLARIFKVSQIVIARRLLDLGHIDKRTFFEFYDEYMRREYTQQSEHIVDPYFVYRNRIGRILTKYIAYAVKEGSLLYRDAYRLTGLPGDTFNEFIRKFHS
jgi:Zn-dependent peptidase ImmA (M78 family)